MKKGFTLIELLAVIVILGIILGIAVPSVLRIIEKSQQDVYKKNEEILVNAAKNYIMTYQEIAPTNVNDSIIIDISDFKDKGIINEIKDPKSNNGCDGYVLIRKASDTEYTYTPYTKCSDNYISDYIKDGLVLDMPLGDVKTGDTYLDLSGNDFGGTNAGSSLTTNRFGEINKASSFDGLDDYISLPPGNEIITNNNSWTISAWANPRVIGSSSYNANRIITLHRTATWSSTGIALMLGTGNKMGMMYLNGDVLHCYMDREVSLNTWYYITAKYDGNRYSLFIDNELVDEVLDSFYGLSTAAAIIGGFSSSSHFFNGHIDDLKIYNRALTSDEVKHNYNVEQYKSN